MTGLYNILSQDRSKRTLKRMTNEIEFFGEYAPYVPRRAAEYTFSELEQLVGVAENGGPLGLRDKFSAKDFKPITV